MIDERAEPTNHDDAPPAADDGGHPPLRQPGDGAHPAAVETTDELSHTNAATGLATLAPRRSLKLVVTLQPVDGAGYRALLALGTVGCDPLLRSAEVGDLAGALDEVAALVADAEHRWQTQPRNPTARPVPKARPARPNGPPASLLPAPPAAEAPGTPPDATGEPASPGQLSLFR
jgi:hypothetical protein